MKVYERLAKLRAKYKRNLPKFYKNPDAWKVKRLMDSSWRRPKGQDNKIRLEIKGYPPRVKIGYRNMKKIRGIHPSGYIEVLVHRKEDLVGLQPDKHAVRIAATVGKLKRLSIIEEANKLGLYVLNPGGVK
ncbi:MAG: 50S ribosomal protein L32e [Thermoprotei archaeon]|jgi:large subunit ribosomal protein L32e